MNYCLFSPIGSTDPVRNDRDGALIHICRKYKPKKIVLFMSSEILENHKSDNRYLLSIEKLKKESGFENWNPDIEIIERADLKEVQKMDNFIPEFESDIKSLKRRCEKGDKILLNVSSGTPAMKYSLQLLSIRDRNLFVPVQVDTPQKACNSDIKEYYTEEAWGCNEDNDDAKFVDRCNVSNNDNLFVYLLKEKITELINNYDYSGALTMAKGIESELNKDFLNLLEAAKQRLSLNYIPANCTFKKHGYKMMIDEAGNKAKMLEYILYLNIKMKTDNFMEFTRGITPIFEDLLYYKVEKKVHDYIISKNGETSKWDADKLSNCSDEFSEFNFVSSIKSGYRNNFIRSEDLIEIIKKYYSSEKDLLNNIDEIREFESTTRNTVAHEIKPLSNDKKKKCQTVFEKISWLAVNTTLITEEKKGTFLNSYDDMNKFLRSSLT